MSNPSFAYVFSVGALANFTELSLAGQPLDRIKTKIQSDVHLSASRAIRHIYQAEGIAGFYKGYRWNILQTATKGATRLGINTFNDRLFTYLLPEEVRRHHPLLFTSAIACSSALCDGTVTNLTDRVKVFEMSLGHKSEIWKYIRARGIGFFFEGWTRTCLRQLSIWLSNQLCYNFLKRHLSKDSQASFSPMQKMALGIIPGAFSALFSTLPDLLKTQAQIKVPLKKNIFESVIQIAKDHGVRGLYRSLGIKIVRSSHYTLVTFLVMDWFNALPSNMKK